MKMVPASRHCRTLGGRCGKKVDTSFGAAFITKTFCSDALPLTYQGYKFTWVGSARMQVEQTIGWMHVPIVQVRVVASPQQGADKTVVGRRSVRQSRKLVGARGRGHMPLPSAHQSTARLPPCVRPILAEQAACVGLLCGVHVPLTEEAVEARDNSGFQG